MRRKVLLSCAIGLLVAVSLGFRTLDEPAASAAERASRAQLRSARGLTVSITLTDYHTHHQLDCGGTYVIQSWVAARVYATARRAGVGRLIYLTNENGSKYWHAHAQTVYLQRGGQVIGRTDQWLDDGAGNTRYTFTVQLYGRGDRLHHPQASARCTVTVSKDA